MSLIFQGALLLAGLVVVVILAEVMARRLVRRSRYRVHVPGHARILRLDNRLVPPL